MKKREIVFGGGCFWGVQKYFNNIKGVLKTKVGYANGPKKHTTYEEVCQENGYVEVVYIYYDQEIISINDLIYLYMRIIDPFSINRQSNDFGVQYRTGIYLINNDDINKVMKIINRYQKSFNKKIKIEIKKLINFVLAEEYHQNYLIKNPNGYCHINNIDVSEEFKK